MAISIREGLISFRGYRTWYRVVGYGEEAGKLPLLCLHGGPGMAHDYLEPLEALAETGRRVIFYDQLGCGRSDHPNDPSLWQIELFVDEVQAIRSALGLERIHLLGQSWGGFLAQEYMLTQPTGVQSLILSNSAASTQRWIAEAERLRAQLPIEIQEVLAAHEQAGTLDDPAYIAATDVYYRRHLCRLDPWPDCLLRTFEQLNQDPEVYTTMWGPTEFYCSGRLKDWNIEERISEIHTPTLLLSGEYDESTPAINEDLHRRIRNSEWVLLPGCSHTPHLEDARKYLEVLDEFLSRMENS
jgi:proline-specific peptidase